MKKYNNLIFYTLTIGCLTAAIFFIVNIGEQKEFAKNIDFIPQIKSSTWDQFKETYYHNITHPLAILLLQIITIILVARFFGAICKKIGQPTVIGEIIAGIFLGPSFIGTYIPEFSAFLFPKQSLANLQFLSQIGLILFMFVIGMELDLKVLKNKAQEAIIISHASIIFPFTLGIGLALFIYGNYAPNNIKFLPFALFIGIAMSITAFPVLARIVQERGLSKTKLGTIAITCAAADDITAWCLLAAVIAIVKAGSVVSAFYTIIMAIVYVLLMLKIVQPFLKRIGDIYSNKEGLTKQVVGIFFVILVISAYVSEVIGIHALFGAFLAGVIMPSNTNFRNIFIEKVEDISLVLLLPLFFVFTGLRTQIGLLNDSSLWELCGIIILIAIVGKFIGSALAAKFVGQNWRDSLIIGALMNTRGLMELVVLNIGYDLGVLSPEIFAMMVLMALITTFMTGPALDIINKFLPEKTPFNIPNEIEKNSKYSILVSFGNPARGKKLIKLANSLTKKSQTGTSITALHLSPSNDLNLFNASEYESESFKPIKREAQKLNMSIITMFKSTNDIDKEIYETANLGNFDLLLIGVGRSMYEGTFLGKILGFTTNMINPEKLYDKITGKERVFEHSFFDDRTKLIIKSAKVPVAVLIDKNFEKAENIVIPIFTISDSYLLVYAQKLIHNNESRISIIDASGVIKNNPEIKEAIRSIEHIAPNHIALYSDKITRSEIVSKQDLMITSLDGWQRIIESSEKEWLANAPSTLIIKA